MIVSVTPIGDLSGTMTPVEVAVRVSEYLAGVGLTRPGRAAGSVLELPSLHGEGPVRYYADSAGLRPGRWLGDRSGDVEHGELIDLIAGVDPDSGEPIRRSVNGAGGKRRVGELAQLERDQEWYSTDQAASVLGTRQQYLQRLLARAADALARAEEGPTTARPSRRDGARAIVEEAIAAGTIVKRDGTWVIHRDALRALVEKRPARSDVLAYDLTFSVPKDVSVIWARGDDEVRANVLSAIDHAVAAGLTYLEHHALEVRVAGEQRPARRWVGAEFLHLTSRALEPQLHKHLLVINRGHDAEGNCRALDGRLLFLHAKTAGYLAAAELRHQLAARLGVIHVRPVNGIAPVLGVPAEVVREFSTRSREITEAAEALGLGSAAARQVAAYDTRAAKDKSFDFDAVTAAWATKMDALGFTSDRLDDVVGRVAGPGVLSERDIEALFTQLLRVGGITEHQARFDRRHVIQSIAERGEERLSGAAIEDLADRFLANDDVVELEHSRDTSSRDVIRRADGRAVVVPAGASFSTKAMLALERGAIATYRSGRDAGTGVVRDDVLEAVLADERFARLSDEQRRFVTSLTTSGQLIQAGVGRAGSGKTTALEAAVLAWRSDGFEVIGAAVGGSQAVVLGEEATGEARTVAALVAAIERGDEGVITDRTVVLVDEASLVSTRDVAVLARAVGENPGASLRLVGDPEQHGSVAAGGYFRYLVEEHAAEVPELTTIYRQQGEKMGEVRLALAEYRAGQIEKALQRLADDGRITEAASFGEALDQLSCAWYAERQARLADPSRRPSSMIAEHHHERLALNRRARALLKADGTLSGPELVVDGIGFQQNDEVIARVGDHDLRADGAERQQWVRNGSRGFVREVGDDQLVVEFERWGSVRVSRDYIEREVVPGVRGGLQHAYALTTFAAQGQTMAAAMPLVSDASSREGTYVALARPQLNLSAVAIRYDRIRTDTNDDGLPRAREEQSDLEATARAHSNDQRERLASQLDRRAARVRELATMTLHQLEEARAEHGTDDELIERAFDERARKVTLRAIAEPAREVLQHLGERPGDPAKRRVWDAAVGAIAIYREREQVVATAKGAGLEWALGTRPEGGDQQVEYDRFAEVITPVAGARAPTEVQRRFERVATPTGSYAALDDGALTARARELRLYYEDRLAQIRHHQRGRALFLKAHDERVAAGLQPSSQLDGHLSKLAGEIATCSGLAERLGAELERAELEIEARELDRYGATPDDYERFQDGEEFEVEATPPWMEVGGPVIEW